MRLSSPAGGGGLPAAQAAASPEGTLFCPSPPWGSLTNAPSLFIYLQCDLEFLGLVLGCRLFFMRD
jgi:hypothetical protein